MKRIALALTVLALVGGCKKKEEKPAAPAAATETSAVNPVRHPATVLDLNTASIEELKAIPEIGDQYAQAIIDHRPYTSRMDLINKHAVPVSVYRMIEWSVTAKKQ